MPCAQYQSFCKNITLDIGKFNDIYNENSATIFVIQEII